MMRKWITMLLCLCLLIGCVPLTAAADEGTSTALSLHTASRLFYAVAGEVTLRPHEIACADYDRNGVVELAEATAAFYQTNGLTTTSRTLSFNSYLWTIPNVVTVPKKPTILADTAAFNTFVNENKGFCNALWMLNVSFDTQALLAVPLDDRYAYVASVTTDETTVGVSLVTLPTSFHTPHTAYALITVDKAAVAGKTLTVSEYSEADATVSDPALRGQYDLYNAHGSLQRQYDVEALENGAATVYVSYTVPSTGCAVQNMRYIATDDVLYVICDLQIPSPDSGGFSVLQSVSGSLSVESGVYTGQKVVLCEQLRFSVGTDIGTPIDHAVMFQSGELDFGGDNETAAERITSLEQLEAAYAAEDFARTDYTQGFTDAYFQDRALILVKPYYPILPYGLTVDGVEVDGNTLHVRLRFTNLDYHLPALYHGRLLIEVDAADVASIDTVVCHEEETLIWTYPQA